MKEVKPCVERNQREDEMRRERDIMMRVSVTICGHVTSISFVANLF